MIKAVFYKSGERFTGFNVSGHAGYAEYGKDIVCAYVSSAVELCCNTITEFFNSECDIKVTENTLSLKIKKHNEHSEKMLSSLYTHIEYTMKTYGHIKLEIKSTQEDKLND